MLWVCLQRKRRAERWKAEFLTGVNSFGAENQNLFLPKPTCQYYLGLAMKMNPIGNQFREFKIMTSKLHKLLFPKLHQDYSDNSFVSRILRLAMKSPIVVGIPFLDST